jgi:hypothetical protein
MAAVTQLDSIGITFNAWESDKIEITARQIFDRSRFSERQIAAFGLRPGSLESADFETIRAHVAFCAIIERAHHMHVEPLAMWGKSRREIADLIATKAAGRKRGAGARAVANKYGDEAAKRITGHAVRH